MHKVFPHVKSEGNPPQQTEAAVVGSAQPPSRLSNADSRSAVKEPPTQAEMTTPSRWYRHGHAVRTTIRTAKARLIGAKRNAKVRLIRTNLRLTLFLQKLVRQILRLLVNVSATLCALLVLIIFLVFSDQADNWKASESHLAAAQVIGAALALVLSLSIIPAQRAAELFSMVILRLYGKDRSLIGVFLVLVATTMLSVLLGTNWLATLSPKTSISIQFLLLGISFDALRLFYTRTLDLLAPQTAIKLVIHECEKQLRLIKKMANRLIALQKAAGTSDSGDAATKAILISGSHVPQSLRYWTSQLEEFAHRFVARRDTTAVIEIVSALEEIAKRYADLRKGSVVLHLDADFPFAGGVSDISEVLNPIYESVLLVVDDAISATNEKIVSHCIDRLGEMALRSMTLVAHRSGQKTAPLSFGACYYLDRGIQAAVKANMLDAVLIGIGRLELLLQKQTSEIDTDGMATKANESLFSVAVAGYTKQDSPWVFRAVSAMLRATSREIQLNDFSSESSLKKLLGSCYNLMPLEIIMDAAGKRRLQIFPAYDLGFEASIPILLEQVAAQVRVDKERPWIDPFHDFVNAADTIRDHYRNLAQIDFKDTLLRKWIVDSLDVVLRVHFNLLAAPPEGTELRLSPVADSLKASISWIPAFFPNDRSFAKFHATDAANRLTVFGMNSLEQGWLDITRSCAVALTHLASNSVGVKLDRYALADMQERLEVLARACEAKNDAALASEFRSMITKPSEVSDDAWPDFLEARQVRFDQLDRALREAGRGGYRMRDDPVEILHELIRKHAN